MDEATLKTSWAQRIVILIIAILLLGSTMFAYLFIVMNNGNTQTAADSDALIAELTAQYDAKSAELDEVSKPLSDKYFSTFKTYLSEVKAYNAASANANGLESKDLKTGDGKTLTDGDTDYLAYYIGWCADGEVFDSSFNDNSDPTSLKAPLDPSLGLIEGWNQGVIGMKIGGVRELNIPSELAYGDDEDAACGANAPLKFVIMAIEDATASQLSSELNDIYMQLLYAYYGNQLY